MRNLINCTPHIINICDADGNIIMVIAPSGMVARVSVTQVIVGDINGIPAVKNQYSDIVGLPDPDGDNVYIVSMIVKAATDRTDVIAPDTGNDSVIRDSVDRIIGVRRFVI